MNEKQFLKSVLKFLPQKADVLVGPGDDCAVVSRKSSKLLLLAVDQISSGIHFDPEITSPGQAAEKLLRRNISDMAAMGGIPEFALLTVAANFSDSKFTSEWLEKFMIALGAESSRWNVSVCGGDMSSKLGHDAVFSLAITGNVEKRKLCLRSGAKDGDLLFATGRFGNSFKSGHHLKFIPRLEEARFLAGTYTNTMIDVSDGLVCDASRLSEASDCGIRLFTGNIPLRKGSDLNQALNEGEDYELLFAVNPSKASRLIKKWPFKKTGLSEIGVFSKKIPSGHVMDDRGVDLARKMPGFSHL
jgi:thiamine-monophosphate kinase